MVKDHSDNEIGNPLPVLHGLLFPISCNYIHHATVRVVHITTFVTPVVERLAGTRNSSMGPP